MENTSINILIHGFCSLTHCFIKKFNESNLKHKIYVLAEQGNIDIDCIFLDCKEYTTSEKLQQLIKEKNINLIISYGEAYAISGLVDFYINKINIPVIGVSKEWFNLEASKLFCKEFMITHNIKTPKYKVINTKKELENIITEFDLPLVLKNNDLRLGFGSYICKTKKDCTNAFNKIQKESKVCIAEEFIKGEECTIHYLWDTKNLYSLRPVKDFKKAITKNTSINTGGVGSYTPINLSKNKQLIIDKYNEELKKTFTSISPNFTGIFATNIIIKDNEIYTLEFNMRPGVTEFETQLENISSDILDLIYKLGTKQLTNYRLEYKNETTSTLAIFNKDYLEQKNRTIKFNIKNFIKDKPSNIKLDYNFLSFDEKGFAKLNAKLRILTITNTSKNNPFKEIYSFLQNTNDKTIEYKTDLNED